ncbi:hypothetical protein Slin15195_G055680 [Septoria linicola]|uniref:Uncharacterized protein n=1 Tax=Septoria linicola TaxID=215465 RepID=A0A9Q9AMX8_9PEZI|nr:hypothetical protein Slin14017_G071550 [Septoria linicola]USW52249.1 hypothetical protein Slin15195_G055680 [Septoria linicola]
MKRPPNCLQQILEGVETSADADIAGTGILIAFILSACLTLFAVLVAYFTGLGSRWPPPPRRQIRPSNTLTSFPIHARSRCTSKSHPHPQRSANLHWHCDSRSGVQWVAEWDCERVSIPDCGVSGLDVEFGAFVRVDSAAALVVLSSWPASLGVVGMLALLVLLLIALVPTVSNDWAVVNVYAAAGNPDEGPDPPLSAFGVPALCFWGTTYGDGVNPDSVLSFLVLFVSYLWKMDGIFMPVRRTFANFFRNPVDCTLEAMLTVIARSYEKLGGRRRLYAFRIGLAVYLPIVAVLETLASFSAALWVSVLGLIFGIMQILIPRQLMRDINPRLAQQESKLGFGQLIPLILLVQPLGAVTEHMWLKKPDDEPMYSDPYSYCLDTYRDSEIVGISEKPLLQYMASYKTPPRTSQAPQRIQLKAFLYRSKLFHTLIWTIQAAVAATAGVVLYADYLTIGYTTAGSWVYMGFAAVAWVSVAPLIVLTLSPWSKLGRYYNRERRSSVTSREGLQREWNEVQMKSLGDGPDLEHATMEGESGRGSIAGARRRSEQQMRPGDYWIDSVSARLALLSVVEFYGSAYEHACVLLQGSCDEPRA